jgi:hypothetical protein
MLSIGLAPIDMGNFTYQVNGRRYLGKYSREGYKSELAELAERTNRFLPATNCDAYRGTAIHF